MKSTPRTRRNCVMVSVQMYQNIECASMILYTVWDPNYRLFRYSDRGHVKWSINQITIGILYYLCPLFRSQFNLTSIFVGHPNTRQPFDTGHHNNLLLIAKYSNVFGFHKSGIRTPTVTKNNSEMQHFVQIYNLF